MKKYSIDFLIGFIVGIVFFLGLAIFNIEWPGYSILLKILSLRGLTGLFAGSLIYTILSLIFFFLLRNLRSYLGISLSKKVAMAAFLYLLGFYLGFIAWFILAVVGFTQGTFGL